MTPEADRENPISAESFGPPKEILQRPEDFEEQIPLIKRTVWFVRQFKTAKPKGKQKLLSQISATMIKDPETIGQFLSNLDLIDQIEPIEAFEEVKLGIKSSTEKEVRKSIKSWSPEKIEKLIEVSLDSHGETGEFVLALETALFNAPKTPEDAVNLHYSAAWAMVTSKTADVREEIFSILCYEKKWFPGDSECVFQTGVAFFSSDKSITRFNSVDEAVRIVGRFLETSEGFFPPESIRANLREIAESPDSWSLTDEESMRRQRILGRVIERNKKRSEILQTGFDSSLLDDIELKQDLNVLGEDFTSWREAVEEKIDRLERKRNLPYPLNLICDPNEPLRKFLVESFYPMVIKTVWENFIPSSHDYKKVTEELVEVDEDLHLDIIAKDVDSPEQKNALVREILETCLTGVSPNHLRNEQQSFDGIAEAARLFSGVVISYDREGEIKFGLFRRDVWEDSGRLATIIQYHRPEISTKYTKSIQEQINRLREALLTQFTRSIGRRGYHLLVTDPSLKQFGFQSFEFKADPKSNAISIDLSIDDERYTFKLNSEFRLMYDDDIREFHCVQDQLWLEILTLSHLKKIMCTDEEDVKDELVGGERQYETYRRQTRFSRTEHLRRLPKGQKFSTEAFNKCLKSEFPIKDLFRINRMRIDAGLEPVTYVSGFEKDIETQTAMPIVLAFENATDDVREVVQLGQYSDEELGRIEREILTELDKV